MIGLGIFANALNILPFAYFLLAPFAYGRNVMPGNRTVPYHSSYYRRHWQRVLFGKHLWYTMPFFLFVKLAPTYAIKKNTDQLVQDYYVVAESLGVDYDEESNENTKEALNKYRIKQLFKKNFNSLSLERAENNYKLKSEVFDDYIATKSD